MLKKLKLLSLHLAGKYMKVLSNLNVIGKDPTNNKQLLHAFLFNIRNYSGEVSNIQRRKAELNIILPSVNNATTFFFFKKSSTTTYSMTTHRNN